jgi:hypothetical protein
MQIIGIVLVRNEERFISTVLANISDFCDKILVVDDVQTKDDTGTIVRNMMNQQDKISYVLTSHPKESHPMIEEYAGTDTWIFAVDGDEIYDPQGLRRFRPRLEAGEFNKCFCVFGNVLNAQKLDLKNGVAEGYLAPPCRSMTKLYNFAAINAWDGPCIERLHGGTIHFRPGYHERLRCNLHYKTGWREGDLRCLHTCFITRSRAEKRIQTVRWNISDRTEMPWWRRLLRRDRNFVPWKLKKYTRGERVREDVRVFFPGGEGCDYLASGKFS